MLQQKLQLVCWGMPWNGLRSLAPSGLGSFLSAGVPGWRGWGAGSYQSMFACWARSQAFLCIAVAAMFYFILCELMTAICHAQCCLIPFNTSANVWQVLMQTLLARTTCLPTQDFAWAVFLLNLQKCRIDESWRPLKVQTIKTSICHLAVNVETI